LTEYRTCGLCGKVEERTTAEEDMLAELLAELGEYFGNVAPEQCGIVCDECWEIIKPLKKEG